MARVHDEGASDLHKVSTVCEFPLNYFLENLAVRRTGEILITVHNRSEVLYLDPHQANPKPTVLHTFPASVAGIVEVEADVFYVSACNIGQKGSAAIFKIDLTRFSLESSPAVITKVVDLPDAIFLNGSAVLNRKEGIILAADSILGALFEVRVKSPTSVKTWIQDARFTTTNQMIPGINGVKVHRGWVYVSVTDSTKMFRVAINGAGAATGRIEQLYEHLNIDDFTFDSEGSLYGTTHLFHSVAKVRRNGTRSCVAGGPASKECAGTTACAFGRSASDRTTLYTTTTGGMSNPIDGKLEPARLLRIDVGHTEALDQHPASVLFVATSHNQLPNGAKTGVWLEEAAEPYEALAAQGIEITVASPKGSAVPIDPRSAPNELQSKIWSNSIEALKASLPLSAVSASQFDGIFLPGGHGPMFDLATNTTLAALLRAFHTQKKPIGSVCHGPAGLANVKLENGQYLVAGKEITCYSWEEEVLAGLDADVPFNLQDTLTQHGAHYLAPSIRVSHVVADGLLVTGQNPASSKATATAFGTLLNTYRTNTHAPSATSSKFQLRCLIASGAAADESRLALRSAHYSFLAKNAWRVVFGGPVIGASGVPEAMLMVVEAESAEAARQVLDEEPYTASGKVFSEIQVRAWRQVLPDAIEYQYAEIK
ncbi:MAG: hypothetical protein M1829_003588 [Trizodia sp. TS-e1964]|nr:MAG: hypothetical protein M1829_003588 [Trizodia sp. TS-e1964]